MSSAVHASVPSLDDASPWALVLDARPPWHRIESADAHESNLRSLFSSSLLKVTLHFSYPFVT
eukprot:1848970-Pleurochrysis_carterae.AAC.1